MAIAYDLYDKHPKLLEQTFCFGICFDKIDTLDHII